MKTVIILPGPTGPTGTFRGVNIVGTGPTGAAKNLFPTWAQYTGPTGAGLAKGVFESVYNIGPTGIKGEHETVIIPGFAGGGPVVGGNPQFDEVPGGNRVTGTSGTVGYQTNSPGEVIVLTMLTAPGSAAPAPCSSVTDTNGLVWARRSINSSAVGVTNSGNSVSTVEMWWAYSAAAQSGTITMTFPASLAIGCVQAASFRGIVNPTDPWDPNPSLPAVTTFASLTSGVKQAPSVSGVSTSWPNSYLINVYGSCGSGDNIGPPSGWTNINQNEGGNPVFGTNDTAGLSTSVLQTNLTVAIPSNEFTWVFVVDALKG
jgi:hypothetical protein